MRSIGVTVINRNFGQIAFKSFTSPSLFSSSQNAQEESGAITAKKEKEQSKREGTKRAAEEAQEEERFRDLGPLRAELEAMKPSARRRRAVEAGATEDELEGVDE